MDAKAIYTSEQLGRLVGAHRVLCAQRCVDPYSTHGYYLAARLLNACDGNESQEFMVKRFAH